LHGSARLEKTAFLHGLGVLAAATEAEAPSSVVKETRWLVSGRTTADMRTTAFDGGSGLLAKLPPEIIVSYKKSLFELVIKGANGQTSLIKGIGGAEEPSAFRGPQFHGEALAAAAQSGLAIGRRGGV
jgi:hypothetical protein